MRQDEQKTEDNEQKTANHEQKTLTPELLKPGMMCHKPHAKLYKDESSIMKHSIPGTWTNGYGTSFMVRLGPNYVNTGIKAPSTNSLYEIFAFDLWQTQEKKINNIARFYEFPTRPPVSSDNFSLPPVLLINAMIPDYDPPFFGNEVTNGKGKSMVWFAELTQSSRDRIAKGSITPAMKLLQKFIKGGKESEYGDRLKVIGRILNPNEAFSIYGSMVGMLISQYNGTPFLARSSPTFYHVPGKYFGIDLDAHLFGKIAKKGLAGMKDYMHGIVWDLALLLEGRTDEENPEQILASIRVSKIGGELARQFPFEGRLKE